MTEQDMQLVWDKKLLNFTALMCTHFHFDGSLWRNHVSDSMFLYCEPSDCDFHFYTECDKP